MTSEVLTDEVRTAYDTVADDYARRCRGTEPEQPVDLAMLDHFVAFLPDGHKDVLDAGCGTGRIARYLADRGCRVEGVDISSGMLAVAARDHPDLTTRVASLTALPYPDAHVDGIVFWYSTIHTTDSRLATVFAEARRVVRPGGSVIVAFQAGSGSHDVGAWWRRLGHDVTLSRYERSAHDMAAALRAAGLHEQARLVRAPVAESAWQAVVIASAPL